MSNKSFYIFWHFDLFKFLQLAIPSKTLIPSSWHEIWAQRCGENLFFNLDFFFRFYLHHQRGSSLVAALDAPFRFSFSIWRKTSILFGLEQKKDIFVPTCADQPLPSTFIEFPEFYITELPKKFLITWLIPFCRTHCWRSWYPFPSRSWLPSFYPSTTRLFLEGQQASFHLSKTQLDVSPLFFLVLLLWRAQHGLLFLYYKLHYQGPNTLSCFPWGLFFKKLWATFKLKVNWISWMSTSH